MTNADEFKNIILHEIKSIEFSEIQNNPPPFGVKIIFENDYIFSTPISDGNTIETSCFNKNNNILNFEKMGSITFKPII
ncbi:MAG: hypothetical protein PHR16_09000 [Methylovulum sp.]|nr:hypothetical protein [Methylovulum sp.]